MGCTLLLALTIGAGLPRSAAAQIYCRNFGADPNDYVDDAETLQNCFNSAPSGATVVLDPGNPGYVLNAHGLTFGANNLTITSSQAPTQTAIIIAGQNLSTLMLDQENAG